LPGEQFVTPDEIQRLIKANIDKTVSVVYVDGKTEELFVHTVDDEGFVCDIANKMSQPPPYACWVRFTDVREARAAGSGGKQPDSSQVSDAEDSKSWHQYRDAMTASTKLMQQNDNEEALRLLDDAIAMAISENENRWVLTLGHHAAVISNFLGNFSRVKHYYQKSLEFNPENPRALAGLADVAQEQGELELAKEYATRCHKALAEGDDFLKDARLETLLKKWPELARH
jgi:tetratricopeptide (TPR) repeat protein